MESVLRAAAVYLFLLFLFRIAGKRSLAQITTFDFVLLLIVGEATQQALLGEDFSVINAWIVVATIVGFELVLTTFAARRPRLGRLLESVPLLLVADGQVLQERLDAERISVEEILAAARELHGLDRLDEIRYAVLERSGGISIVPKHSAS